eukprot:COSAG01_NODE_1073_length_11862_cov_11.086117_5_plen_147_part_00
MRRELVAAAHYHRQAAELEPASEVFRKAAKQAKKHVPRHFERMDAAGEEGGSVVGERVHGRGMTRMSASEMEQGGPPAVWARVMRMGWAAWHAGNAVEGIPDGAAVEWATHAQQDGLLPPSDGAPAVVSATPPPQLTTTPRAQLTK